MDFGTSKGPILILQGYQSRAFLLLPMCFNVGVIVGLLMSGFLADPVHSLPSLFGGVQWLVDFPYALPNLVSSIILGTAALAVILGLDETHPQLRNKPDPARRLGKFLMLLILGHKSPVHSFIPIHNDTPPSSTEPFPDDEIEETRTRQPSHKLRHPFRSVLTRNVCLTMLQRFLQSLHVSAFNSIFFSLLPAPKADEHNFHMPFRFTGGLGLSSKDIGFANTTIGMIGILL